jgi:lysophospholipase L1-like esterase
MGINIGTLLCMTGWMLAASAATGPLIQPGDHVAIVGNTFADQLRKYGYFETLLAQECPGISVRNLGWAGDTVSLRERPTNFPREDETLAAHKTDVILLSFGMSEAFAGPAGIEPFKTDLEKRVHHYKEQRYNTRTPPRLILVSPIRGQDLGHRTPRFSAQVKERALYTLAMKHLAADENIGFMDLFTSVLPADQRLTTNGIHLNEAGYRWISRRMIGQVFPDQPWQPTGFAGDGLIARDLAPGYHALYLDDKRVTTATHEDWARGMALELPADPQVEKLRTAIVDKNAQFTFSWKALNQVHIVGERKKSNSGRALPEEVLAFNQLTLEHEAALQALIPETRIHSWKLLPDPERTLP